MAVLNVHLGADMCSIDIDGRRDHTWMPDIEEKLKAIADSGQAIDLITITGPAQFCDKVLGYADNLFPDTVIISNTPHL